jgi:hypothetical protein
MSVPGVVPRTSRAVGEAEDQRRITADLLAEGVAIGQAGAVLHPELVEALDAVLADLATGGVHLDARDSDDPNWENFGELRAMVWAPDGSGVGISVGEGWPLPERTAAVADQIQEIAIEARWASQMSATWPECPAHPNSHPLQARVVDGRAVWCCPETGAVIAEVGTLSA